MVRFAISVVLVIVAVASVTLEGVAGSMVTCSGIVPMRYRNDKISITDFGGVGDGRTVNTKAFREAIYRIQHLRRRGGTLLYVPPGVYLTGSFSLASHMTLYLARGAVIKATQVKLFLLLYFVRKLLCMRLSTCKKYRRGSIRQNKSATLTYRLAKN